MTAISDLGVARNADDWEALRADAILAYLYKCGPADTATLVRVARLAERELEYPLGILLGRQLIEISEDAGRYIYATTYIGSLIAAACLARIG